MFTETVFNDNNIFKSSEAIFVFDNNESSEAAFDNTEVVFNNDEFSEAAFIQDERQESYEWLLQCCLEAYEIVLLIFVTDKDPAIIAAISKPHYMQCLYHLYQNILQNLHLYIAQDLAKKYAPKEKYITMILLDRQHIQVKCFILQCFIAKTQFTHAESENALIQKAVQSSFSLLEVQEALENRLEFESINNCYSI
ncbi:31818_t:CDS:2 [Gigaspora margarita]|uniref:31818_t:CDS:1 n=1 Tax=Gigaspora margarita TaxID=4874 RepID=A0ABN7WFE6_GIGMA|nr:31818_t:CDS:2 [Gigaspora margarita]